MSTRLDSVLVVDYRRSLDGIPDEVMALLPLFDGNRSARDALRRGRVPDAHASALVERLRRLGIVCEPQSLDYGEGAELGAWLAQKNPPPSRSRMLWVGAAVVVMAGVTAVALVQHRSRPLPAASAVAAAPMVAPPPVVAAPVVAAPVVAPPVVAAPVVAPPVVAAPVVAPPVVAAPADDYPKLIRDARALLNRGAYGKALDAATRASQAKPDSAEPFLIIGTVEQQKGRAAQAQTAYKRYLALAPKGAYATEIRSILRTLH